MAEKIAPVRVGGATGAGLALQAPPSQLVAAVALYDMTLRRIATAETEGAGRFRIAGAHPPGVYLLAATLPDGSAYWRRTPWY